MFWVSNVVSKTRGKKSTFAKGVPLKNILFRFGDSLVLYFISSTIIFVLLYIPLIKFEHKVLQLDQLYEKTPVLYCKLKQSYGSSFRLAGTFPRLKFHRFNLFLQLKVIKNQSTSEINEQLELKRLNIGFIESNFRQIVKITVKNSLLKYSQQITKEWIRSQLVENTLKSQIIERKIREKFLKSVRKQEISNR